MGLGMGLIGAILGGGKGRGDVLEALKHPIVTQKKETFEYGRKGSSAEGLVTEHKTSKFSLSVGDGIAIIIAGSLGYLAYKRITGDPVLGDVGNILEEFVDPLGIFSTENLQAGTDVIDAIMDVIDPLGLGDSVADLPDASMDVVDVIKEFIDPGDILEPIGDAFENIKKMFGI